MYKIVQYCFPSLIRILFAGFFSAFTSWLYLWLTSPDYPYIVNGPFSASEFIVCSGFMSIVGVFMVIGLVIGLILLALNWTITASQTTWIVFSGASGAIISLVE
ncbi:MAG: hypothetical protein DHS20C13_08700 [Thermodesulfobacteriota bacterium]|nr:MAG: hypothetical protein DHS20C13_08700 [Thermodesulfobacteriota bacterium]